MYYVPSRNDPFHFPKKKHLKDAWMLGFTSSRFGTPKSRSMRYKPQTCHLVIWQGATSKAPESRVSSIQELETPDALELKYVGAKLTQRRPETFRPLGPKWIHSKPKWGHRSPSEERIEVRFWPWVSAPPKLSPKGTIFGLFSLHISAFKKRVRIEPLVGWP